MYVPWVIIGVGTLIVWWMIEKRDVLIERRNARIQELEDLVRDLNSSFEKSLDRNDGARKRLEELEDQNVRFNPDWWHSGPKCPLCEGAQKQGQEQERTQVEAPQTPYKHILGEPWGDPSSYSKALTAENLEQAREALHRREAEKRERDTQVALEHERKKVEDEKREQEAREFLARESERVRKEREDREKRREAPEREPEPIASAPVIIVRPPSKEAEAEVCKCGYPGCLGHEVIDNHAIFPGFTSEAALTRSPHEIVRFLVEMVGVAGNPSDGELPVSAIRTIRKPHD